VGPHEEWIEIPVPALITEERSSWNRKIWPLTNSMGHTRTIEPSILQGLVHCRQCSYALYRSSSRSSAHKIYYYRCLVSDAYRHAGKALCDQKPIRQDFLDQLVWDAILRLLEEPALIQKELNRRQEAARDSSPTKRRLETLSRDLIRVRKSMKRLLTAYQEELLPLDQLRVRMPPLHKREQGHAGRTSSDRSPNSGSGNVFTACRNPHGVSGTLALSAQTLNRIKSFPTMTSLTSSLMKAILNRRNLLLSTLRHKPIKVIFCVRGVTIPSCGVPARKRMQHLPVGI
jgi:hypothetical protein